MNIDTPYILAAWSTLLTLFGFALSWMINRIFKLLDDLRREDELIRRDLTSAYVRRDDFMDFKKDIISVLERIEKKIDGKVDK